MANQAIWNKTKFCSGDTVTVHHKVKEGNKERVQIFEGIVISINGAAKSFTVRKTSAGIGVERIWPLLCPSITKIQVKKKGKVRRAKLYYLRKQVGKKALKIQEANATKPTEKETGSVGRAPSKDTSSK